MNIRILKILKICVFIIKLIKIIKQLFIQWKYKSFYLLKNTYQYFLELFMF